MTTFEFVFGVFAILGAFAILAIVAESEVIGEILAYFETDGDYRE